MSMIVTKDPHAVLDYGCDWQIDGWLGADTIISSSWDIPSRLKKESEGFSGGITTVWLSGGTVGARYTITNRIVTADGRTDDRSLIIVIKNR